MEMTIDINGKSPKPRIINVKQYTSGVDTITFNLNGVMTAAGELTAAVVSDEYRQSITLNGNTAVWCINSVFTSKSGTYNIQLEISNGESVWKSDLMMLIVSGSVSGEKPPESGGGGYGVVAAATIKSNGTVDNGVLGIYAEVV